MILTSNTEATENKVQFFNLAYRVKGFHAIVTTLCNCLEGKQQQQNNTRYLKVFFVIFFS